MYIFNTGTRFTSDFPPYSAHPLLIAMAQTRSILVTGANQVNVFGTLAITESLRPLMNPNGAILNISSANGSIAVVLKRESRPGLAAYSFSKTALDNLTVQWALEEKKKGSGIRVVYRSAPPPSHPGSGFNATKINSYTGTMSPAER
ncbi:hypothetical protein B0H15DRAFT_805955 [Mycena belliarum]|uniref:Uncharacterized protein n=1 Tax=Mycena belliarum TaxID=1033014 RepID=A0AAD6XJS1_9AGAR|nr:hypothetical protein B0H15DRAFT_805955 [Mycena belliae]